ncbi:MAG: hypothetical protein KDJ89_08660, partial [Notoacmeibacter sp.]|nr:hypothetical protein [Notoacmeibacter sp.]
MRLTTCPSARLAAFGAAVAGRTAGSWATGSGTTRGGTTLLPGVLAAAFAGGSVAALACRLATTGIAAGLSTGFAAGLSTRGSCAGSRTGTRRAPDMGAARLVAELAFR